MYFGIVIFTLGHADDVMVSSLEWKKKIDEQSSNYSQVCYIHF